MHQFDSSETNALEKEEDKRTALLLCRYFGNLYNSLHVSKSLTLKNLINQDKDKLRYVYRSEDLYLQD